MHMNPSTALIGGVCRPVLSRVALVLLVVASAAPPAFPQRVGLPGSVGLPPEVVSLACAPTLRYEPPPTPLRVTGSQDSDVHRIFAPGDLITINAGSDNGIDVGQQYYTRRAMPREKRAISRDNPAIIRTTGWIRIYAVDDRMSLATIVHPCDSIELNDYLEPFVLPAVPAASSDRPKPQRGNYGRVTVGNDNRRSFGLGDYFVVDRGSDHGVTPGAQFVVYRDNLTPGNFLFELGEAIAVDVRPDSSTLQVTLSRDGFLVGDYVAIRK
jgi:hypothetical protein